MERLIPILQPGDIPSEYRDTPISKLVAYHNLQVPFDSYQKAELLIGQCMDHRKHLNTPANFAYILRTGGANLRYVEFHISYAIAVASVRFIVLIGHNHCGMVNLMKRKEPFVQGLVETAGWDRERAEEHFTNFAPMFEVGNEIDFTVAEAKRLRLRYPKITVAPMLYLIEDNKLYFINESA